MSNSFNFTICQTFSKGITKHLIKELEKKIVLIFLCNVIWVEVV